MRRVSVKGVRSRSSRDRGHIRDEATSIPSLFFFLFYNTALSLVSARLITKRRMVLLTAAKCPISAATPGPFCLSLVASLGGTKSCRDKRETTRDENEFRVAEASEAESPVEKKRRLLAS